MKGERIDIKAVFLEALEKGTPEERRAYLADACQMNPELRAEFESLLSAYDQAGDFLEVPPFGSGVGFDIPHVAEGPGTVIGRYKLLEKIGEGGMAVVYMAEQQEPIRRKVALKIIKLGMDTRQVIARFEAERQALALMDHPSIAKVFDAGATETGRPYFVMELVTGVSITEYCDKNSLSTKDRLTLFLQVCQAVQHAHQKGIIHRDIKPSNVMVTLHDGKPVPKVIDFGIAKAINQKLTEKTLFTRYAHLIGTPAYMSPEQAELSDLDIDTRSDIYSLGVLLYELLTGTTPFSEEELRKAGYIEMQRVIREQEPIKPSTKLGSLGGTLTDIAKCRNCTPDLLRKAIRGDLDWIVMKSLEKDRARRYETASSLTEDIRRHLEHEPILARGPNSMYRLRKFLRRHRWQTIAALATVFLGGAAVVVLSLWNRDRFQLAEVILSQAQGQYAGGEREAALETMQSILRNRHVGPDARLLQAGILVDNRRSTEAETILTTLLQERREIAGAAHSLLARILWESGSLGAQKLKEIEAHRRQAGALLPETAEAYFQRAMIALTVKDQLDWLSKALRLSSRHYEARRLRALTYYASRKYEPMSEDAAVMEALRDRDPLGHSLHALALRELGRYQEAIVDYDDALAWMGEQDPHYCDLLTQRSETLLRMGDYQRVVADTEACLNLSPSRADFRYHLFGALTALGDYGKATAVFQEIIRSGLTARTEFRAWAAKYVFDTLEAGRVWHPVDREPTGAAFLPLVEAEEIYHKLSTKAHRVIAGGFSAQWSPDGQDLAFSLGVHGYSGVAVHNLTTRETHLLIVPGKDPKWSPDGKYIAFVRDCQALPLEELTSTERKDQDRMPVDEEVWLMNRDGTEPQRLARGGWPSWSRDSALVYYHSRLDKTLCAISVAGPDRVPKRIMACPSAFPAVSPDGQRMAYLEGNLLKVRDLTARAVTGQWQVPFGTWGGPAWSPTGKELCLGAGSGVGDSAGLWIYQLDHNEPVKVLGGQIGAASWTVDGTQLVFGLRPPYFELWVADVNPAVPVTEALGPGQTLQEHWQEMVRLCTRRVEADSQDASAYSDRARHYDLLHERSKASADMKRWSAVMSGRPPWDSLRDTLGDSRHVIGLPFGCELVFSAERPVNAIPVTSIAFGQKGRWKMKLFELPMVAMSLLGFGLLSGLDALPAQADFTFGTPVNAKSVIPILDPPHEYITCCSSDGLEIYIDSDRSGGYGNIDLWVLRRSSINLDWGPPENLGPAVNTSKEEAAATISADGLTLYFNTNAPGGQGSYDIYMTTRATKNSPWEPPVNLGPKVNSARLDAHPCISPDNLELYFISDRPGGYGSNDLYVSRRATANDPWGGPVNLGPAVNDPYNVAAPHLSPDGLLLFFQDVFGSTPRPGGYGGCDIWMTRRATVSSPWQMPVNLGPVINSAGHELGGTISPDGSTLYFMNYVGGIFGNWQVPIIPTIDFNGDGKVDLVDLVLLIDNWGTNKTLYDIGPMPWGDGKVDIEDLKVFMTYYEKENPPAKP